MNQKQFESIIWNEFVHNGKKFLEKQDCVCSRLPDTNLFLLCVYHQNILQRENTKEKEGSLK